MSEFSDHGGPVHDVEFHPHEFLLASASQDRTVSFWDLESFSKLSSSEKDTGPVRYLINYLFLETLYISAFYF